MFLEKHSDFLCPKVSITLLSSKIPANATSNNMQICANAPKNLEFIWHNDYNLENLRDFWSY